MPAGAQATERFGWGTGTGAVMAASILVVGLINHAPPWADSSDWILAISCAVGAPALATWEVIRRRNPVTLAVRAGKVGVYRGNTLAESVPIDGLSRVVGTVVGGIKLLAACLVLGGIRVLFILDTGMQNMVLFSLGVGIIGFAAVFAWSVVRTRMQLVHFRVTQGESHEEVLLERPDAERLFGKMSDRPGSRASR